MTARTIYVVDDNPVDGDTLDRRLLGTLKSVVVGSKLFFRMKSDVPLDHVGRLAIDGGRRPSLELAPRELVWVRSQLPGRSAALDVGLTFAAGCAVLGVRTANHAREQ